jgi:hypothetical protein
MSFHWGNGPSQINQVVAVGGSGSTPTTPPSTAAAKVGKKASKAAIKTKPSKDQTTGGRRVVAYELVFTSSVTRQQLTVRVPGVGAFHDPNRPTTIRDLKMVGKKIADAINSGFHDTDKRPT